MNAESVSFLLLAIGILGTHAATLRLLYHCKRELSQHIDENVERSLLSSQSLDEIVRIGADVADAVEGLVTGISVSDSGGSPVLSRTPNIQEAIIEYMVDRFMPSNDASKTQQERPIYQEYPQTENNEQDNDPEATQV